MPLHPPLDRNSDTDRNANSVLLGLAAEARRRAELQRRRPRIALEPSSRNRFEAKLHRFLGDPHHELVEWVAQVDRVDARVAKNPDALARGAWLIINSEVEDRRPGGTNAFRLSDAQLRELAQTIHDHLATTTAARAMEVASVRLGPQGPASCPVGPATVRLLGQLLTTDAIAAAIDDEVKARMAFSSGPETWSQDGPDDWVASNPATGLHAKFGPGTPAGAGEHGPFGRIASSNAYGVDSRFTGLGVGTRLYRLGAGNNPGVRWDCGSLQEGSLGVRRKLHGLDPYIWRYPDCPKCGDSSGISWRSMSQAQSKAIH
jgi:hypothetical protein